MVYTVFNYKITFKPVENETQIKPNKRITTFISDNDIDAKIEFIKKATGIRAQNSVLAMSVSFYYTHLRMTEPTYESMLVEKKND